MVAVGVAVVVAVAVGVVVVVVVVVVVAMSNNSPCCDNYAAARHEISEIVRVARDNPAGLIDFLKANYPKDCGLTKEQHMTHLDHLATLGWINVNDKMPSEGLDVLVCVEKRGGKSPRDHLMVCYYRIDDKTGEDLWLDWCAESPEYTGDDFSANVTKWRLIPSSGDVVRSAPTGEYENDNTAWAWMAWQAAHALIVEEHEAEIERIKQNHGCARGQRTTQWCGEAAEAKAELAEARREIERLRSER